MKGYRIAIHSSEHVRSSLRDRWCYHTTTLREAKQKASHMIRLVKLDPDTTVEQTVWVSKLTKDNIVTPFRNQLSVAKVTKVAANGNEYTYGYVVIAHVDLPKFAAGDPYYTVDEIKQDSLAIGHYWFEPDTMKFFSSRVGRTVYFGKYFISSERRGFTDHRRAYTIRTINQQGFIDTVGEFLAYQSADQAVSDLRRMVKSGELK